MKPNIFRIRITDFKTKKIFLRDTFFLKYFKGATFDRFAIGAKFII